MRTVAMLWCSAVLPLAAQADFPSNPTVGPKKYTTREVGGEIDPGAKIERPAESGNVRYVSHIVLHASRIWLSTDGKPVTAKLIAFEDMIVEAPKGASEPPMPEPPAKPTVVKEGKVRLLVERKAYEVPLDRLVPGDQELIEGIRSAIERKAANGG